MRTWYGKCENCGMTTKVEETHVQTWKPLSDRQGEAQDRNHTAPSSYICPCGNGVLLTHFTQYEWPTLPPLTDAMREELSRPIELPIYDVRISDESAEIDERRPRYGPPPTGE